MPYRWIDDLLFSIRTLRNAPGFALVAVLALALGIGANTAIFSGVKAILLGPLPFSQPERLVTVWEDASAVGFPKNTPAAANYVDWRKMNHVFSDMALLRYRHADLTGGERPEAILGRGVTANFFDVLGAHPLLGRTFTAQEDNTAAKVLVISYGLWQSHFSGTRDVVGRTLRMNDEPRTVIGVMPPGFSYPDRQFEYWEPIRLTPKDWANRGMHGYQVVARLRPGVTLSQAEADMSAVAAQLQRQYPNTNRSLGAVVIPLRSELVGDTREALLILLVAAVFVLLIACANVANLLLTRGAERRRELAVRAALGASRTRLIRQLIVESLVLSCAGALVGLLFGWFGMSALQALIPKDLVNSTSLSLDVPILLFAIVVSFVSGLLFGLLPALESSRLDLNQALKQGGRAATSGSHRLRNSFVVSQVALALVLVSGAGLLIETLTNLRTVDLGFPSDHLLTMRIPRAPDKLKSSAAVLSFTDRVLERVMQVPGVRSAGFASDLPFTSEGDTSGFRIQGRALSPEDQFNDALYREASNHYLQTLGARSISGRLLDERDTPQSPLAVVINETFARRYWPHESPLGAHLRFGGEKNPWRTIVGVIADVKERGLQRGMKPGVYLPFTQVDRPDASFLLVRTAGDPATLANSIRQAIWSIDPEQPVADIRTMEEYAELEMRTRAHQRNIFAVFAGLALFLAALGIYGVLAYAVAQRTREIGIRVALGADTLKIIRAIVGEGFALTSVGILVGTALAALSLHAMKSVLFGVKPTDPAAFSVAAAVLLGAALAACMVPAFTASRVDPVIALRNE